ncbi:hypothetical protein H5410_019877 [Solanum commersonii]|uniref:Uncharacterized protein n=1 Tax=Solanum commersonii TaxID=4109 RepID=A0A9J5ZAV3_SOLCO|nr:hypothetical protein H5410_019877 [Solanum commersonii]
MSLWTTKKLSYIEKVCSCKMCWNLTHKQNKLWIRWIHTYYTKGRLVQDIEIQACWMVGKNLKRFDNFASSIWVTNLEYYKSLSSFIIVHGQKLVYTKVGHAIWIERNGRIFEKRFKDKNKITKKTAYTYNI